MRLGCQPEFELGILKGLRSLRKDMQFSQLVIKYGWLHTHCEILNNSDETIFFSQLRIAPTLKSTSDMSRQENNIAIQICELVLIGGQVLRLQLE